tara:strand:- start:44 stop:331 length:288 start_codon:yes stop_codon:yes gene_type:complete
MNIKKFRKLIINTSIELERHEELRVGQVLVNELCKLTGSVTHPGMPNNIDPFYNDLLVPDFLSFLIIGIDNVKKQIEAELLIEGFKNLHLSRIYL